MKPVNDRDLKRAYITFMLYFITLLLFSVLMVFFYFVTSNHEVSVLNDRIKESEKLIAVRNDINYNFDIILQRMQKLTEFNKMDPDAMNNESLLLNDIQDANQKIQASLQNNPVPLKSFALYKKLSDDISIAATIKDSLFTTRFQIESLRSQLQSCNKVNTAAANQLRGFRR